MKVQEGPGEFVMQLLLSPLPLTKEILARFLRFAWTPLGHWTVTGVASDCMSSGVISQVALNRELQRTIVDRSTSVCQLSLKSIHNYDKSQKLKLVSYKLQQATCNRPSCITTAIKLARKWAAPRQSCLSVNQPLHSVRGLIPSIRRCAVIGCKLQVSA